MNLKIGAGPKWYQLLPQFDRRARFAYWIIGGVLLLELALFRGLGFRLGPTPLGAAAVFAAAAIYSGTMLRRAGWERASLSIEGIGLLSLVGWIVFLLQYPLIAIAVGSPDSILLSADRLLHFDWTNFSSNFQSPISIKVVTYSYNSMIAQGAIIIIFLSICGRTHRTWQFLTSAFISLILSILLLPFFAAEGKYVGCGLKPPNVTTVGYLCDFGTIIHRVRDLGVRTIDAGMIRGLVSFPSFHAAMALLLTWAIWPFRSLRIPFTALNTFMSIGAIVIGGHYFVDVLGGFVLSLLATATTSRILPEEN